MNERVGYLMQSTWQRVARAGLDCPNCGGTESGVLARKWLVTELRRCARCRLMFRAPVTSAAQSERYYQSDYESGMTTTLPSEIELARMLADGFSGTEKSFDRYIALLRRIDVAPGARVLDYGSSWGYGTWQFKRAGYDVTGFEVSRPRARYAAEQVGVDVRSALEEAWVGTFDAVFSAHVLEHVPSIAQSFAATTRLLKPGGLFVAITPNGSLARRIADPVRWSNAWGHKHPNLLDEEYWALLHGDRDSLVTTDLSDEAAISMWGKDGGRYVGPLNGGELLAACRV